MESLPTPWGKLASDSVRALRSQGAALLPTLRRLRQFAEYHSSTLQEAKARSSQALGQAWVCAGLVPLFGIAAYLLLPGISEAPLLWFAVCTIAGMIALQGAFWLIRMAERARWAGLERAKRSWQLLAPATIERFLALLRAGKPPDQAWCASLEILAIEAPDLATAWGYDLWRAEDPLSGPRNASACARILAETGNHLRKAIQVSLMEGRPCAERIETALSALRGEIRAQIDVELNSLPNRALKPLFFCIAPALFGLLGAGLFLAWQQAAGGFGGG